MFYYKITLSYDGSAYKGWQRLVNCPDTIQQSVETILSEYTGENIYITGSGRTDAGVHAIAQTANFAVSSPVFQDTFSKDVNAKLPADIRITSISQVSKSFHSRKSATDKTYAYCISLDSKPDVFSARYVYNPYLKNPSAHINFNIKLAQQAASLLTGSYDFSAFTTDKSDKSHLRTINSIKLETRKNPSGKSYLVMLFNGNGFLYNMVRILAGTLWEVGTGIIPPSDITLILNRKNRALAGPTLPSNALFLVNVNYKI